jgi:hypothetical protein
VVDQLSEMEEIRPTHARRPIFDFLVLVFLFLLSLFPKFVVPSSPFFFFFFIFILFTQREMEEGDRSESWSDSEIDSCRRRRKSPEDHSQRGRDRDRPILRHGGDPADSRSPAGF